jgi:hypothetical protein
MNLLFENLMVGLTKAKKILTKHEYRELTEKVREEGKPTRAAIRQVDKAIKEANKLRDEH